MWLKGTTFFPSTKAFMPIKWRKWVFCFRRVFSSHSIPKAFLSILIFMLTKVFHPSKTAFNDFITEFTVDLFTSKNFPFMLGSRWSSFLDTYFSKAFFLISIRHPTILGSHHTCSLISNIARHIGIPPFHSISSHCIHYSFLNHNFSIL